MKSNIVLRRRFGFTLVETLVVFAIIAILAAILLPVLSAARTRAKIAACEANMYQGGRSREMPEDSSDPTHCPYPQGDDDGAYIDVSSLYNPQNREDVQPDGGTVREYCVEHLKKGTDTRFQVPLEGKFVVLKFAAGTSIVDAKSVIRCKRINGKWVQIPETGEVPVYPEIWHFSRDDFPP